MPTSAIIALVIVAVLVLVVVYDVTQKRHAVLRNFPIIGHLRYLLEFVGPELRQYIVTGNDAERPFSRDQRSWIYASAKHQNSYSGFGTDNDLEQTPGQIIILHDVFPAPEPAANTPSAAPDFFLPSAKVIGARNGRTHAFRPNSLVNISGMSFGALGPRAVEALNRGAAIAGCLHNTGEGGLTPHHQHGADLVFQIGTAYFGCRDEAGHFSLDRLREVVERNPVRMIEIKLSQGAKPGHGGILPGAKVTREIAAWRGVAPGVDCVSPPGHSAFRSVPELVAFIEQIADATGLPVGIKSAVGTLDFWHELAQEMRSGGGPDYILIDGGEGGTGAAPFSFADHVSLPFKVAFTSVYRIFADAGLHRDVAFIGSARLGFPEQALLALALGCDMINVGREAMMTVGCIQSQRCHTGHCPTGVATQSPWLNRGLDPISKAERCARYITTLREELLALSRTCGHAHPALVDPWQVALLDTNFAAQPAGDLFNYNRDWHDVSDELRAELDRIMLGAPVSA